MGKEQAKVSAKNNFFRGLDIVKKPINSLTFQDLKKTWLRTDYSERFDNGTFGFYVIEKTINAKNVTVQAIWKSVTAQPGNDFNPPDKIDQYCYIEINENLIGQFIPGDFFFISVAPPDDGEELTILVIEREFRLYE
jgi:hypothetical protein